MTPTEMFHAAMKVGLTSTSSDPGRDAGEAMIMLARDRGLLVPSSVDPFRSVINHGALADLIVTAIRGNSGAWLDLDVTGWRTSAMLAPDRHTLRRFIGVAYWNDERERYFKRTWHALGEIARLQMPMQLVVAVIGPLTSGRRQNYWTKALFNDHSGGVRLRFRLRRRSRVEGFAESWKPIFREHHDEIERERWLQAMLDDGVLQEMLHVIDLPVPDDPTITHIRELAARQLARLGSIKELPEKQLSTCDSPLHPCPFRVCCWSSPESKPEDGGFDEITA